MVSPEKPAAKAGITCSICLHEGLPEIGELSACAHTFCFSCIKRWADESENRCPLCRARFVVISRKRLAPEGGFESDDCGDGSEDGPAPLKRLRGEVVEEVITKDRVQEWRPDELLALDLENLRCEVCGTGEDETHLMLCDGHIC
mmetsp:Transcript_23903/g.70947  ORF Transcript_23903/g.70947 Transcript_23903/m.70947 type:complete len:145 (-) Transcript_23903:144-578(-)